MKPAAEKFAEALEQTAIELPTIPVIQNVNAGIATDVAQLRLAVCSKASANFSAAGFINEQ
jgi:[acyl-carrier-protein] S-malonyltransferase